jgi:hypothetical protein
MILAGPGRAIKNERRNQRGRYTRPAQARQPARHQRGTRRSARGPALGEQQRRKRGRHRDPGRKRIRPTTSVQPVLECAHLGILLRPADVRTITTQTATAPRAGQGGRREQLRGDPV